MLSDVDGVQPALSTEEYLAVETAECKKLGDMFEVIRKYEATHCAALQVPTLARSQHTSPPLRPSHPAVSAYITTSVPVRFKAVQLHTHMKAASPHSCRLPTGVTPGLDHHLMSSHTFRHTCVPLGRAYDETYKLCLTWRAAGAGGQWGAPPGAAPPAGGRHPRRCQQSGHQRPGAPILPPHEQSPHTVLMSVGSSLLGRWACFDIRSYDVLVLRYTKLGPLMYWWSGANLNVIGPAHTDSTQHRVLLS